MTVYLSDEVNEDDFVNLQHLIDVLDTEDDFEEEFPFDCEDGIEWKGE